MGGNNVHRTAVCCGSSWLTLTALALFVCCGVSPAFGATHDIVAGSGTGGTYNFTDPERLSITGQGANDVNITVYGWDVVALVVASPKIDARSPANPTDTGRLIEASFEATTTITISGATFNGARPQDRSVGGAPCRVRLRSTGPSTSVVVRNTTFIECGIDVEIAAGTVLLEDVTMVLHHPGVVAIPAIRFIGGESDVSVAIHRSNITETLTAVTGGWGESPLLRAVVELSARQRFFTLHDSTITLTADAASTAIPHLTGFHMPAMSLHQGDGVVAHNRIVMRRGCNPSTPTNVSAIIVDARSTLLSGMALRIGYNTITVTQPVEGAAGPSCTHVDAGAFGISRHPGVGGSTFDISNSCELDLSNNTIEAVASIAHGISLRGKFSSGTGTLFRFDNNTIVSKGTASASGMFLGEIHPSDHFSVRTGCLLSVSRNRVTASSEHRVHGVYTTNLQAITSTSSIHLLDNTFLLRNASIVPGQRVLTDPAAVPYHRGFLSYFCATGTGHAGELLILRNNMTSVDNSAVPSGPRSGWHHALEPQFARANFRLVHVEGNTLAGAWGYGAQLALLNPEQNLVMERIVRHNTITGVNEIPTGHDNTNTYVEHNVVTMPPGAVPAGGEEGCFYTYTYISSISNLTRVYNNSVADCRQLLHYGRTSLVTVGGAHGPRIEVLRNNVTNAGLVRFRQLRFVADILVQGNVASVHDSSNVMVNLYEVRLWGANRSSVVIDDNDMYVGGTSVTLLNNGVWSFAEGSLLAFINNRVVVRTDSTFELFDEHSSGDFTSTGGPFTIRASNNTVDIARDTNPNTNRHVWVFRFYQSSSRAKITHPWRLDVADNRIHVYRVPFENNNHFEVVMCHEDVPYANISGNFVNVTAAGGLAVAWRVQHFAALVGEPRQWTISNNVLVGTPATLSVPLFAQVVSPPSDRHQWPLHGNTSEPHFIHITGNTGTFLDTPAVLVPSLQAYNGASIVISGNNFTMTRSSGSDAQYPVVALTSSQLQPVVLANGSSMVIQDNFVTGASGPLLAVRDAGRIVSVTNRSTLSIRGNVHHAPAAFTAAEAAGTVRTLFAALRTVELGGLEPRVEVESNRVEGGFSVVTHVRPDKSSYLAAIHIATLNASMVTAGSDMTPDPVALVSYAGNTIAATRAFDSRFVLTETSVAELRLEHVDAPATVPNPVLRVARNYANLSVTDEGTVTGSKRVMRWVTVVVNGTWKLRSSSLSAAADPAVVHFERNTVRVHPTNVSTNWTEPAERVAIHADLFLLDLPSQSPAATLPNRTLRMEHNAVINATGYVVPPRGASAITDAVTAAGYEAVVHCANAVLKPLASITGVSNRADLPVTMAITGAGASVPAAFDSSVLQPGNILGPLWANVSRVQCPTATATFTVSPPPTPTNTPSVSGTKATATPSFPTRSTSRTVSSTESRHTATFSVPTPSTSASLSATRTRTFGTVSASPSASRMTPSASVTATQSLSQTGATRTLSFPTPSSSKATASLTRSTSPTPTESAENTETRPSLSVSVSDSLIPTESHTATFPTPSRSGPSATWSESATIQVCELPDLNVTVDAIATRAFIGGRTVTFNITLSTNGAQLPPTVNSTFGIARVSRYSEDGKSMEVVLSPPVDEYVSPFAPRPPVELSISGPRLICEMASNVSANVSIQLVHEIPPVPPVVQSSVGATSALSAMGTTTSSGQVSRMDIVVALGLCAFELDEPMDTMLSPTGLTVGEPSLAPIRGAVVGNFAVVIGWFVAAVAIAGLLIAIKVARSMKEALRLVHLPGVGAPVALLLLPGTASATTTLIVHGTLSDPLDAGLAAFGFVQVSGFLLAMVSMATVSFVCVLVPRYVPAKTDEESALRRTIGWRIFTTAFQSRRKWVVSADKQRARGGSAKENVEDHGTVTNDSISASGLAAAAEPLVDNGAEEHADTNGGDAYRGAEEEVDASNGLGDPTLPGYNFKAKYGPAFIDFYIPLYLVAETVVAAVLGVIDGVKLTWFCAPGIYAACGIQAVLLIAQLVLRPGMSAALNIFLIVPSACSTLAAAAAVLARWEVPPGALTWFDWSSYLALGANGVVVAKLFWDLIALALWFKYHQAAAAAELRGLREALMLRLAAKNTGADNQTLLRPPTPPPADEPEPMLKEDGIDDALQGLIDDHDAEDDAAAHQRTVQELLEDCADEAPRGASPAPSNISTDSVLVQLLDGTSRRFRAPQPVLVRDAAIDLTFIDDLLGDEEDAATAGGNVGNGDGADTDDELDALGPIPALRTHSSVASPLSNGRTPRSVSRGRLARDISRDFSVADLHGEPLAVRRYDL